MELIEELKWQARGKSYDTLPIYQASSLDLNEQEIKAFIQERKERKKEKITDDLLLSYYLIYREHSSTYATVAGILLFGKQPQRFLSEAFIMCSHFKGKQGRDAIASIDCTGTLFEQFQTAFNFIVSRLSHSFSIKGVKRKEILEIPEEAIRESLLNAIVHRNYHISSCIKIAIYDDRIEFFSPGSFPASLNIENLKTGISYIRNIALCKVFREAGYIEKMGSGLPTIFHAYEKRGLKQPIILEGENFVKCILPREKMKKSKGDTDSILNLFNSATKITVSDVIQGLGISRTSAGRRLNDLASQGEIEKIGQGRGSCYIRDVKK
jgi:ATP-dependent DNA helicase RecG